MGEGLNAQALIEILTAVCNEIFYFKKWSNCKTAAYWVATEIAEKRSKAETNGKQTTSGEEERQRHEDDHTKLEESSD